MSLVLNEGVQTSPAIDAASSSSWYLSCLVVKTGCVGHSPDHQPQVHSLPDMLKYPLGSGVRDAWQISDLTMFETSQLKTKTRGFLSLS